MMPSVLPLPKYRKWTMAEVPVGQVVRQKWNGCDGRFVRGPDHRFMILGVNEEGVHILGEQFTRQDMLNEFTMEDGSPCGVAIA